jgi:protein-ribulosamine 3-kinase
LSSSLPSQVAAQVAEVLDGPPGALRTRRLGGGCIHPAAQVRTQSGSTAFLKWASEPGPSGFVAEARGLEALAERGGLRIPRVLASEAGGPDRHGWLLLEFIEEGSPREDTARRLGQGLAHLHRTEPDWAPGWDEDGWLASLPQPNPNLDDWPTFWVQARLLPRWEVVAPVFDPGTHRLWDRVLQEMEGTLEGWVEDGISLLHGDLWSGNLLIARDGAPVLIDPAVYRGHREVDLAMMELFGGFPQEAFQHYRQAAPLASGYEERRRDAYQLYPQLVHVELFGQSYAAGVEARLRRLAGG